MTKIKVSEKAITFMKQNLRREALLDLLPLDNDSVYDLIHLLEFEIEVPLTQAEEEGEKINENIRRGAVDVIDELNKDPDNLDYDFLNQKLQD